MDDRGLTILVVEDMDMLQAMAARILELGGHRAIVCATGEAAIARIDNPDVGFDLVLTDIGLGGVDGLDVVEVLCRRRPGTPVVIVSGDADAGVLDRVPPGCPARFVAKPYSRLPLLAAVDAAWREASTRPRGD